MKYEDFLTSFPYGSFDYNKALKDEILVGKNLGTYGAPVYGAESVKGILIEDLFLNMGIPFETTVTLSFGDILTGNSSPIVIVPAISGYFIVPIFAIAQYDAGSTPFDDSVGEMVIQTSGTDKPMLTTSPGLTTDLVNKQVKMKEDILTAQPLCIDGSSLVAKFSEDSTVGDGEIVIYLTYKLVKRV